MPVLSSEIVLYLVLQTVCEMHMSHVQAVPGLLMTAEPRDRRTKQTKYVMHRNHDAQVCLVNNSNGTFYCVFKINFQEVNEG